MIIEIAIAVICLLSVYFLLRQNHKAEFFDIFGIIFFIYLSILGIVSFFKNIYYWWSFSIFLIGIMGLIVDSVMVYRGYIKKKR
jgi:hypothetical protein